MDDDAGKQAASAVEQTGKSMINRIAGALKKMLQMFMQVLKLALKALAKFLKWLLSVITSNIYVFAAFIIIIAVIAAVILIAALVASAGYDPNKGTMSSMAGVTGEGFYGQRYFYYDEEQASQEIADSYLEFTYNLLNKTNSQIAINIDYTKPYNQSTQVADITLSYACDIAETTGSLLECATIIPNYGFTEQQKSIALNGIAEYVVNHSLSTSTQTTLFNKFTEIYEEHLTYMNNVCKKIFIKDIILHGENETASDIPKENYFGFVYMPKKMVQLQTTEFVFKIDEEKTVDISVNYTDGVELDVIETATADSSWYQNFSAEKALSCNVSDYILNPFTAIGTGAELEYLQTEKSLFTIIKDGKFATYFKDTQGDYSEEKILTNINSNGYIYLQLTADAPFNMAEGFVQYKQ